jgi:hypothetical protein
VPASSNATYFSIFVSYSLTLSGIYPTYISIEVSNVSINVIILDYLILKEEKREYFSLKIHEIFNSHL